MLSVINKTHILNGIWIILILITYINSVIADNIRPDFILTLFVCISTAIKGSLVADYFMGLLHASPLVRWLIHFYVVSIPIVIATVIFFLNLQK